MVPTGSHGSLGEIRGKPIATAICVRLCFDHQYPGNGVEAYVRSGQINLQPCCPRDHVRSILSKTRGEDHVRKLRPFIGAARAQPSLRYSLAGGRNIAAVYEPFRLRPEARFSMEQPRPYTDQPAALTVNRSREYS